MQDMIETKTNNNVSQEYLKDRNANGLKLKSGPILLNKRKLDAEIDERSKARLDGLLKKMKHVSLQIERAMKPPQSGKSSSSLITQTPSYIENGQMKGYQIHGLNWMIALFNHGLSGILADEMGLGKTLQSISLIGYLQFVKNVRGQFLVVVPLTTLTNWQNEFKQWCPSLKVLTVYGSEKVRRNILRTELKPKPYSWDVCLTTYEMCKAKFSRQALSTIQWHHIILDEGARIKNEKTVVASVMGLYKSKCRIILTGTPLSNNLHELWALFHFLMPNVFNSSEDFDDWFRDHDCLDNKESVVENLHSVLKPILLRRLKTEVEQNIKPRKEMILFVDITHCQREWYRKILEKDIQIITGSGYVQMTHLNSMFMQLRKCTNHPYLFPGAEDIPYENGEHIVNNSGKMIVLDKLLTKLKEQQSRVLIFSQMTRILDIIEDYLHLRNYQYCRLDGKVSIDDRTQEIFEFQKPKSTKFIFLLSTRAGGLGINLTAADVVIIYDSDWNPQMDLQAIARAHRIGQTKEVRVFRLIAKDTVDEKVIERANLKLQLDEIVIQSSIVHSGQDSSTHSVPVGYKELLLKAVRFGADSILSNSVNYNGAERDKLIHENVQNMINQMFNTA